MKRAVLAVAIVALFVACGKETTPSRDHYPVLREKVFRLQQAVAAKNPAAIDSLMSAEVEDLNLGPDSLLSFVYGPSGALAFETFGDCEILYTDKKARIDCWIMDSTHAQDRPVTFTFVSSDDTLWLLKRFEITPPVRIDDVDSIPPDTTR
ncbi:MAG: hypothetical protein RBT76_05930 [candidate division Zixibacteria bacterium]|jgi:hypothetical protein|nr:hypothetical protein [candidate division Zixibacteria bacterium]